MVSNSVSNIDDNMRNSLMASQNSEEQQLDKSNLDQHQQNEQSSICHQSEHTIHSPNNFCNYNESTVTDHIQIECNNSPKQQTKDHKSKLGDDEKEKVNDELKKEFYLEEYYTKKDYITSYKQYSIYLREIDLVNKSEVITIKCKERRFQDFINIRACIKHLYPYIIIPVLPPKDYLAKVVETITSAFDNFYKSRKEKLEYFINYLSLNSTINQDVIYKQFLYDQVFRSDLLLNDNIEKLVDLDNQSILIKPRPVLAKKSSIGSFINYIYSGSNNNKINRQLKEENEKILGIKEKEYKSIKQKYKQLSIEIVEYLQKIEVIDIKSLKDDTLNIRYLQDYKKDSQDIYIFLGIIKEYEKYERKIISNNINSLKQKVENYELLIEAVDEMFSYYNQVLSEYSEILQFSKSNSIKFESTQSLIEEKSEFESFKSQFEKRFLKELEIFQIQFEKDIPILINDFTLILKNNVDI